MNFEIYKNKRFFIRVTSDILFKVLINYIFYDIFFFFFFVFYSDSIILQVSLNKMPRYFIIVRKTCESTKSLYFFRVDFLSINFQHKSLNIILTMPMILIHLIYTIELDWLFEKKNH